LKFENLDRTIQGKINKFIEGILEWYEHNKRDNLFWRRTKNPYYILVSEMMLQKTTVNQVQGIIQQFIKKFPTPKHLASASVEEIERLITPLGMEHRRAARFKKWAVIVVEKYGGKIPDSEEELVSLPGVGRYMANSVLCLAYGREVPILDTNIVRILQRVFDIKSEKARARTDEKLWSFVGRITPIGKSRDLNLSLLDHGALVCTAKKPKCDACPVNDLCTAFRNGKV
jgi:A/G-specific adenine glycosylase